MASPQGSFGTNVDMDLKLICQVEIKTNNSRNLFAGGIFRKVKRQIYATCRLFVQYTLYEKKDQRIQYTKYVVQKQFTQR